MTATASRPPRSEYMRRLAVWILGHRLLVTLGLALVTAGAVYTLSHAQFGSSLGKLFFGDSPNYQRYVEYSRTFSSDQALVVGLEGAAPLDPATLSMLEKAIPVIEAIPNSADGRLGPALPADDGFGDFEDLDPSEAGATAVPGIVKRVDSVLTAYRVRRTSDGLQSQSYAELARARPDRRAELQRALRADGLAGGVLVSRDGRHTALIVQFYAEADIPAELWTTVVDAVHEALIDAGFAPTQIHLAGVPALNKALVGITLESFQRLFPITVVVLIVAVLALFRRFWPAIAAATVAIVGVIWTMALAVLIDRELSVMHTIAPVVILIVGASDVIHLCSAYLLELGDGKAKEEAIICATAEVGHACLYTSLTTLVGFFGLTFVPTPVFRQLGITLGTGVAFALFIAVFFVPVLLSVLPTPKASQTQRSDRVYDLLDRTLTAMANLTLGRPRLVVGGFVVAACVLGAGLTSLSIDAEISALFRRDHEYIQDREWLEEHFVGSDFMQIVVDAQRPDGLLTPEVLGGLAAAQETLEADPAVDSANSVTDLFSMLHTQLTGQESGLPETKEAIAQYALPLESLSRGVLDGLMDFERRRAIILLRLNHDRVRELALLGDTASRMIESQTGGAVQAEATGLAYLTGDWLDTLVAGQRRGLGFTFVFITVLMIIGLRSFRVGLWSMVPNVLPLFALGGYLGLTVGSAHSDVLVLAMLAIGIGVDDTVHFLMRFRIEAARSEDAEQACRRTFHFAGRAIVMTTVVLSLGFIPLAFSPHLTIAMMGTLLPLTLVVALLADLLLVPALAQLGLIRFGFGRA